MSRRIQAELPTDAVYTGRDMIQCGEEEREDERRACAEMARAAARRWREKANSDWIGGPVYRDIAEAVESVAVSIEARGRT